MLNLIEFSNVIIFFAINKFHKVKVMQIFSFTDFKLSPSQNSAFLHWCGAYSYKGIERLNYIFMLGKLIFLGAFNCFFIIFYWKLFSLIYTCFSMMIRFVCINVSGIVLIEIVFKLSMLQIYSFNSMSVYLKMIKSKIWYNFDPIWLK